MCVRVCVRIYACEYVWFKDARVSCPISRVFFLLFGTQKIEREKEILSFVY